MIMSSLGMVSNRASKACHLAQKACDHIDKPWTQASTKRTADADFMGTGVNLRDPGA